MKTPARRQSLADIEPPHLTRRVCFDVVPDTYDPRDAGCLTVTVDPKGVSMHWAYEHGETWAGTWADLRDLIRAERALADERKEIDAEWQALRESIAEVRGEHHAPVLPLRKEPTHGT